MGEFNLKTSHVKKPSSVRASSFHDVEMPAATIGKRHAKMMCNVLVCSSLSGVGGGMKSRKYALMIRPFTAMKYNSNSKTYVRKLCCDPQWAIPAPASHTPLKMTGRKDRTTLHAMNFFIEQPVPRINSSFTSFANTSSALDLKVEIYAYASSLESCSIDVLSAVPFSSSRTKRTDPLVEATQSSSTVDLLNSTTLEALPRYAIGGSIFPTSTKQAKCCRSSSEVRLPPRGSVICSRGAL
mmetsp:Transcript_3298/g.8208  ORF Transcript_3298/g.8208 Transcript_3298/m.8208 type:complete len:240 (+) Transcript_3298:652-1371(+)